MPSLKIDDRYEDAEIEEDTILYRITSPTYADAKFLLNGMGSLHGGGRFHRIHQPTSYCANNILLCIAEKLYHTNRLALRKLTNNSYAEFRKEASRLFVIVVFKCNRLSNLVYIDSSEARHNYQLNPSTITQPDPIYVPLQAAADQIRQFYRNGIIYPSARHSKGYAVALFGDQSQAVKQIEAQVRVVLSLVREDLSLLANAPKFDPVHDRLSHQMGHFAFNPGDFTNHQGILFPFLSKTFGYIDLHRVYYGNAQYPDCALK